MGNALRPMIEPKESAHGRQIWRHDLYIWQRGELPIACVMIAVLMRMHDEQGKAYAILEWQKRKDRLRQRHLVWIRDGAGINQKRLLGSNEQVEKVRFRVGARILPQDKSLRFVGVYLQRSLR